MNIFFSISVDLAHYEIFRTKVGNGSYPVGHKPMLKQACTSMQSHIHQFLHRLNVGSVSIDKLLETRYHYFLHTV